MKKLLLSLAMVATMGISVGANAVVAIDDGSSADAIAIAGEYTIPAGGLITNSTTNQLDLSTELGFGTAQNVSRAIRIDWTNATVNGEHTFEVDSSDCTMGTPVTGVTPSVGGSGDSFLIFEFDNTCGEDLPQEAGIFVRVGSLNVSAFPVTVQYRLFENSFAATDPDNNPAGSTESDTVLTSSDALEFAASADSGTEQIDVTQDSTFFNGGTGDDTTPFGNATLDLASPAPFIPSGGDLVQLTSVSQVVDDSDSDLTVTGEFGAAANLGCNGSASSTAASILDGADAVFPASATDDATFNGNETYSCFFEADGTTIIEETTFSLTANLAGQTGFNASVFGPFTLSEFDKNGSSAMVNVLLNSSLFVNTVRILNKSSIAGDVSITIYNDGGDSVTFPLSVVNPFGRNDIITSSNLGAGEATPAMRVSDLITAARTVDSGFGQTSALKNKYRIVVDAEFGSAANPVRVQVTVVSNGWGVDIDNIN